MQRTQTEALRFVLASLPMADRQSCDPALLRGFVAHALRMRDRTPWGRQIPEAIFRSFVLIPRVNNEALEPYWEGIGEALWPRVRNLSMREAALEANYWCLEKATYQSTDERTAPPLTVMRRAFGRCGEESTLLVSALRTIGIPARQCYAPRWAHCDDNHAWVEAWVDGTWHFMGACEPAPALDIGWFVPAASRAMLVHTRGFGWQGEGETLLETAENISTINRTAAYAACRVLTVFVREKDVPKPGVFVRFELANMGELYPIHTGRTDAQGRAALLTGLGTLHLHLHDGARFLTRVVDVRKTDFVEIDFWEARETGAGPAVFDMIPPREADVPVPVFPESAMARHARRVEACHAIRAAYVEQAPPPQGNGAEVDSFLADARFAAEDKQALLETLTEKDLADCTAEMLADALITALPYKLGLPYDVWQEAVLAPRVEWEALRPVRQRVREAIGEASLADGPAVWRWLQRRVQTVDSGLSGVFAVADAYSVLRDGKADARAMDVLFVTACRAFGIPARLDPVTGAKAWYQDGAYRPLFPQDAPAATLTLRNASARPMAYGVQFTIGRLQNAAYDTLRLPQMVLTDTMTCPLAPGQYRVLTCARQIDGSMLVRAYGCVLRAGEAKTLDIAPREGDLGAKLLRVPLNHPALEGLLQKTQGRESLLLFVEPGMEPTEHLLGELLAQRDRLRALGAKVLVVDAGPGDGPRAALDALLAALPQSELAACEAESAQAFLRQALHTGDRRLPLAVAVNRRGEGLFAFVNYNVGTGETLADILAHAAASR